MDFKEIYGDLIKQSKEGDFDLICHGCNCKNTWGAGIAKILKEKYPLAFETDINSTSRMGTISVCRDYDECIIVNAYTQLYPGSNGWGIDSNNNRYIAIRECMKSINEEFKGNHIGLPLIGCGLAGLEWDIVKKIIKEELVDMDVTIIHLNK